jgi:AraC family transcriptional regulator
MSGPRKHNGDLIATSSKVALAPWRKRRVQELLKTELSGDLSILRLATECQCSSSHFAAAFKESFGEPVHKKVVALRVLKAKSLLMDRDISLAEVALQVGFADQTSFTRTFRVVTGASPGKWRKQQNPKPIR